MLPATPDLVGAPPTARHFNSKSPLITLVLNVALFDLGWMSINPRISVRGHRALRRGRYSQRHRIYHVSTATLDRRPVFADLSSGRIVVRAMRREDEAGHTETLAFVVLPDHLHWLVRLTGTRELSSSVSVVKSYTSRRLNKMVDGTGPVWQRGYYDHALRDERSLQDIARYIVANPIRAGLANRFGDYPLWDVKWI